MRPHLCPVGTWGSECAASKRNSLVSSTTNGLLSGMAPVWSFVFLVASVQFRPL